MKLEIQLDQLNEKYVNAAADLIISAYIEEKTVFLFCLMKRSNYIFSGS